VAVSSRKASSAAPVTGSIRAKAGWLPCGGSWLKRGITKATTCRSRVAVALQRWFHLRAQVSAGKLPQGPGPSRLEAACRHPHRQLRLHHPRFPHSAVMPEVPAGRPPRRSDHEARAGPRLRPTGLHPGVHGSQTPAATMLGGGRRRRLHRQAPLTDGNHVRPLSPRVWLLWRHGAGC